MTKIEALKACVWLEGFIEFGDRQNIFEHLEALKRVREIQKLLAALPDEAEG